MILMKLKNLDKLCEALNLDKIDFKENETNADKALKMQKKL